MLKDIITDLQNYRDPKKAEILQRYFKTNKGEYGYGDVFWGISVPVQRKVAMRHLDVSLKDIDLLLKSKIHEHRFTALEILVARYEKGDSITQKKIFDFYLRHTKFINNWDLVDTSASYILGHYLFSRNKNILYRLARSKNLWERRMAIIATHYFIRQNKFADTLKISKMLLNDPHPLIHKATGWMLREVGKRSIKTEEDFIKKNCKMMPKISLSYAMERWPKNKSKMYHSL